MKKAILLLFTILSISIFASPEQAIINAVKFYDTFEDVEQYFRTAKQLQQPNEVVTTVRYNNRDYSAYTKEIAVGSEYQVKFTLYSGFQYNIIAAGDDSAVDVDVFIYDGNGNTVALDRSRKNESFALPLPQMKSVKKINALTDIVGQQVSVKPKWKEKFTGVLKLRKATGNKASVAILISSRRLK